MLRFNSDIRYGLRAVLFLAKEKRLANIKEISEAEKIPADFLEKIMLKLKNAGIVNSLRGKTGGYKLAIDPKKINLEKIFNALDEKLIDNPCIGNCDRKKTCQAKTVWKTIDQTFKQSLKQIKLSQIIK